MFRSRFFRSALLVGSLALVSGCTPGQSQPNPGEKASLAGPMEGCGMMIDGKMVYAHPDQGGCMTMNKPGNMMPSGVTMHSDPARP
jgi:hypothetical protein